jgi:hypothetical protein
VSEYNGDFILIPYTLLYENNFPRAIANVRGLREYVVKEITFDVLFLKMPDRANYWLIEFILVPVNTKYFSL